jgi:2'-hydroxyisoflavone reductase
MKVLVLGGTRFIGRHIVNEFLNQDADVTVIHRGWSPSPFGTGVRQVHSDRRAPTTEASHVLAKEWDAIVDTSGQDIDHVRGPLNSTVIDAALYVYASTCAVYSRPRSSAVQVTERSPLLRRTSLRHAEIPAMRRLQAERFIQRHFKQLRTPLLTVRLGLTVGPYDQVDRLAYWLERANRGGDMLVPMHPDQNIQLIDVRDVAKFVVSCARQGTHGTYNVAGFVLQAQELIKVIASTASQFVRPCWVEEQFALRAGLTPWTELPFWLPTSHPERALMAVSSTKALQAGLAYRSIQETVCATAAWRLEHPAWNSVWLDPEREQRVVNRWRGGA